MSGPALKQPDSHSSIHESALGEARELNRLLSQCIEKNDPDRALEVAYITVEHWETRTLRHAESEEEGLYKEAAEMKPELRETIVALTRDHTLMRNLVRDIKCMLAEGEAGHEVLQRFQALILVDMLHNEDEEKMIGKEFT